MIMDGIDGRIARLTRTQSAFGNNTTACRIWCFGLAPALVMYEWSLHGMVSIGWAKLGWLSAFLPPVPRCGWHALMPSSPRRKKWFKGLPSPSAGCWPAWCGWGPTSDCGQTWYIRFVLTIPGWSW